MVSVSRSTPLLSNVPTTVLQSATAENVPLGSNVTVYFACSSAGTTPWKAGTFSWNDVSCQVFPVSSGAVLAPHAASTADSARTTEAWKARCTGMAPE
jgi:hypothetical protein